MMKKLSKMPSKALNVARNVSQPANTFRTPNANDRDMMNTIT